jgi:hypothetical protein
MLKGEPRPSLPSRHMKDDRFLARCQNCIDSAQMARSSSVKPWFHHDADERAKRLLLACLLTAANVIDWVEGILRRGVRRDGEDGLRCEDGRLKERPARSLSRHR